MQKTDAARDQQGDQPAKRIAAIHEHDVAGRQSVDMLEQHLTLALVNAVQGRR